MTKQPETGDAAHPPSVLAGDDEGFECDACNQPFQTAVALLDHDCPVADGRGDA